MFESLPYRLLVVGEGHLRARLEVEAPPNVSFLGNVEEARLVELYRTSRALVYPAERAQGVQRRSQRYRRLTIISIRWRQRRERRTIGSSASRTTIAEPLNAGTGKLNAVFEAISHE